MKIPRRDFDVNSVNTPGGMTIVLNHLDKIKQSVDTHIDAEKLHETVSPSTANQEFKIIHNLGYKPSHFLLVHKDGTGDVYASSTAWTSKVAYFKCSGTKIAVKVIIW